MNNILFSLGGAGAILFFILKFLDRETINFHNKKSPGKTSEAHRLEQYFPLLGSGVDNQPTIYQLLKLFHIHTKANQFQIGTFFPC